MKIYISVDLEGVNGVSRFSQTYPEKVKQYEHTINQLHKEINIVVNASFLAGATSVYVNDAHGGMINLKIDKLDPRACLITGKPKSISMMAGLDQSFNAVIFLGYHCKASTVGACLAHTFNENFNFVKINSNEIGEAYLNSLYAATLNIPIAFVSGEELLCEEIYQFIGDVPRVITKKALGFNAVVCKDNNTLLKELEEKTIETLNNPINWIINRIPPPYKLEVGLTKTIMADLIELTPCITRTGAQKVEFTHPDFSTVYQMLQIISVLSDSVSNYY